MFRLIVGRHKRRSSILIGNLDVHSEAGVERFQFNVGGIEGNNMGSSALVLHTPTKTRHLRVQIPATDAQFLAAELAGVPTIRMRLGKTMQCMAEQLDATLVGVHLFRHHGNMVEAEVLLEAGLREISMPITFGDGIALACCNKLPISGDESLDALMQTSAEQTDEPTEPVLSRTMEAFLNSLPPL